MAAKTLADEYGAAGSRVNVVLPGRIDTDRVRELDSTRGDPDAARAAAEATIPLGRYGTPEEFGTVTAFVTSPAASYLSGTAISVDGGATRVL
jgi:3-oxoacyl-[acyl-carrier protein] reductase